MCRVFLREFWSEGPPRRPPGEQKNSRKNQTRATISGSDVLTGFAWVVCHPGIIIHANHLRVVNLEVSARHQHLYLL